MLKSITIAFATSLSLQAAAQTPPAVEDFSTAFDACDRVIEKQGELILLQKNRIDELQTDNEKLSQAIIELNREQEKQTSPIVYGSAGIVLGIILTTLIRK